MSGHLLAAYIFGSVARLEQDDLSDLDVLAVVETGKGMVEQSEIAALVPPHLQRLKLSISWYGRDRLQEMFENGELFAWHLANETSAIFDPHQIISTLGRPSPYDDAQEDVASFMRVFSGIGEQVSVAPLNAAYEAGLIYVCIRNIGMAASSRLCERPDFSRYSIFNLGLVSPCPITLDEFNITMRSRMAAQRGYDPPPQATAKLVLELVRRLTPWLAELRIVLEGAPDGRSYAQAPV